MLVAATRAVGQTGPNEVSRTVAPRRQDEPGCWNRRLDVTRLLQGAEMLGHEPIHHRHRWHGLFQILGHILLWSRPRYNRLDPLQPCGVTGDAPRHRHNGADPALDGCLLRAWSYPGAARRGLAGRCGCA